MRMGESTPHPDTDVRGLSAASLILHSARSRDELMLSATQMVTEMLHAEGSSVVLKDEARGDLVFYVVAGDHSTELSRFRLAEGEGLTGHCIRHARPLLVNDVQGDTRFSPRADLTSGFQTRSLLGVPLLLDGECVGAFTVVNCLRPGGFTQRDVAFCELVASHIAMAVSNVQLRQTAVEEARLAALGQTVAGAAHCMKNLTLVLRGGVHLLKKELAHLGTEAPSRGLQLLEQNVARLATVVDEMLTYAKEALPNYAKADLGEIVRSAAEALGSLAQEHAVALEVDVAPGVDQVELDNGAIYRCVLNLVANAIEACEARGGTVRVRAFPRGDEVVVEVIDQGCGMDAATRESLFVPFFTTKGARGTGLGLSVTRKLVEDHRGRIEVDSAEEKGATFRLFLPARRPGRRHSLSSH